MTPKEQLELLQDSWKMIWQSYMTWFNWHIGIHVVALGFVVTKAPTHEVKAAIIMIALSLLGVGAAWRMYAYDVSTQIRANELIKNPEGNAAIFGGEIIRYARFATIATNLLYCVVWVYVAYIYS